MLDRSVPRINNGLKCCFELCALGVRGFVSCKRLKKKKDGNHKVAVPVAELWSAFIRPGADTRARDESLGLFAWVCADDAQVGVTVAGVRRVVVASSVGAGLELISAL